MRSTKKCRSIYKKKIVFCENRVFFAHLEKSQKRGYPSKVFNKPSYNMHLVCFFRLITQPRPTTAHQTLQMCSLGIHEHILTLSFAIGVTGGELESKTFFFLKILFSLLCANGRSEPKILLRMCSWDSLLQLWFCDAETIFSDLDLVGGDGLQPQKISGDLPKSVDRSTKKDRFLRKSCFFCAFGKIPKKGILLKSFQQTLVQHASRLFFSPYHSTSTNYSTPNSPKMFLAHPRTHSEVQTDYQGH